MCLGGVFMCVSVVCPGVCLGVLRSVEVCPGLFRCAECRGMFRCV